MTGRDARIERARAVPIECEAARRGIPMRGRRHEGPCPVCGGRDRFWINAPRQAWGCRGCGTGGDVIALVMHLDDVPFTEALGTLTDEKIARPQASQRRSSERECAAENKYAADLWAGTVTAFDTLVATYLRSRGITIPVPPRLRFAKSIGHRPTSTHWPGMIGLVTGGCDDAATAVHRTFLAGDGSGKAPIEPQKMILGPCHGGAVRLADADDFVMIGEGIETCLAAMQATGLPAWAALSTSGLMSLPLPRYVRRVTILADGDEPGLKAAQCAGQRWLAEGREVRIARPPDDCDFNDLLARGGR